MYRGAGTAPAESTFQQPEVMRVGTGGGIEIAFDPNQDYIIYIQRRSNHGLDNITRHLTTSDNEFPSARLWLTLWPQQHSFRHRFISTALGTSMCF